MRYRVRSNKTKMNSLTLTFRSPQKSKGILYFSGKLMYQGWPVSGEGFKRCWAVILWPWPLTLNNNRHLPLIMLTNCTKLYDGSVCTLPTMSPATISYHVTMGPWPLTLKNNRHLPLIMMINCIKLYDPRTYGLFGTIRSWPLTSNFEKQ